MNEDILNACYKAFEKDCYKYVVFSESNEGEITFYEMRSTPDINYLYTEYYGEKHNRAKFHLFNFIGGKLEWVESYNFKTKKCDLPLDIDDDVFLIIAKKAHEKDITINEEITNIFRDYINGKAKL